MFRANWLKVIVIFFLGIIISTLYYQVRISNLNAEVVNRVRESNNLRNQIHDLSELYRNPITVTPSPKPLQYKKVEGENYSLICNDFKNMKSDDPVINKITKKTVNNEEIVYLCNNTELNQFIFITYTDLNNGAFGRPAQYEIQIKIYNNNDEQIKLIEKYFGNYIKGMCNKIISWTDKPQIIYKCEGGDGPLRTWTTLVIDPLTGEKGIIESCMTSPVETKCNRYCDKGNPCQNGFFCNLETNNCVKYCENWSDCKSGYDSCKPFGPVRGCDN